MRIWANWIRKWLRKPWCESHISLTLWIGCVAKVTRQAGDAKSGRRDLKRDWVLNTHCRKHQLWERPAQNRGVLMQIGNHAVLGIRIDWKPLWWLINLHCCQELSLALVGQPVTAWQRETSLQPFSPGSSGSERGAACTPQSGDTMDCATPSGMAFLRSQELDQVVTGPHAFQPKSHALRSMNGGYGVL